MEKAQDIRQRLFDTAARHMLQQGKKARASSGECCYRHQGLMCAVGALINDEHYSYSTLEGHGMGDSHVQWAVERSQGLKPGSLPARMLQELQRVHDNHGVVGWRAELFRVAKKYRLDDTVVRRTRRRRGKACK